MALIYCPQCGQSVSDKAAVCPHCGSSLSTNPVINTNLIKCEDCGAEYTVYAKIIEKTKVRFLS